MWVLKSQRKAPPGNFLYEQTEGIYKKFDATPLLDDLARVVTKFRKGNNLPRANLEKVLQEVEQYNCARLGNNPRYCYDTERPYVEVSPIAKRASGGCGGCGARVQ